MKIISGIYWDRGKRETNQDSVLVEQVVTVRGRVLLAAVCDGIGGLSEGETASGFILEKLLQNFYEQIVPLFLRRRGKRALKRSLLRCFWRMNKALRAYGESRECRLGSTVSLLLVWQKSYLVAHLGDSRVYKIQGKNKSKKLTEDHSDGKNGLMKCMGSFSYQTPDMLIGKIRRKTGFLLCSDGFFHCLTEKRLAESLNPREITSEEQIERRLYRLSEYDRKQGEGDNISAVYVVCGR